MQNEELFKEKPVWSAILTLAVPSVLSILVMLLHDNVSADGSVYGCTAADGI